MPTLNLSGTRSKPAAKPARRAPARKPAATRKPNKPAKRTQRAAKPAPAKAQDNGAVKLPEGWTKQEFNKLLRDMERALSDKAAAQEALSEAQEAVNSLALEAIGNGVSMAIVVDNLKLSRQWLYTLMDKRGVQTERQATAPHPNKGLTQDEINAKSERKTKQTAKKSAPARRAPAKKTPARKAAAKKAPARKAPAKKTPARKAGGRGRMTLSGRR